MAFLDDLARYRGNPTISGQSLHWIELLGGEMVPIQFYEPDATTFRSEYYYNARENVLYQRVATLAEGCSVNSGWVWKRITERR